MIEPPAPEHAQRHGPDLRLVPAAASAWLATGWATGQPSVALVAMAAVFALGLAVVLALAPLVSPGGAAQRSERSRLRRLTDLRSTDLRSGRFVWWARVGRHRSPTRRIVSRPQAVLVGVAVGVVLCATAVSISVRRAGPLPGWIGERAVLGVEGVVAADPRAVTADRWEGRPRYLVRVTASAVTARGRRQHADAPLVVIGAQAWSRVSVGDPIRFDGRATPTAPGDDAVALVAAMGSPQPRGEARWWWRVAERVRADLRQAIEGLPEGPAGLLPSLVVGDTSTLTPTVEADLRASGLTHLTAVSGANVAIVLGAVLALAVRIGWGRRARVAACATALVGFVVVARPEPSVLRAAVMGAVVLAGLLRSRRGGGVPALAAAVVVLLTVDPYLSRSAGFALSVGATAALLLLAPPWARRLERWVPRPVALAVAAPAAAQTACAPLLVLLHPSISTVAVPANLLADPAVVPATLLGVTAAVLAPIWPHGAHLVAAVGCLATWWIIEVGARFARLPAATVAWLPSWRPGLAAAALLLLTVVVVLLTLRLRPPAESEAGARAGRSSRARPSRATVLLAGSIGLVVAAWWGGPGLWRGLGDRLPWPSGRAPPADWTLAQCDVGQGDALVVRTGLARAVLVDTGPDGDAVDRCLDLLGIRSLDLVVLSHFHADHVIGVDGALRDRSCAAVVTGPLEQPAANAAVVRRVLAGAGVPLVALGAERDVEVGADGWRVRWRLLPPPVDVVPPNVAAAGSPDGPPAPTEDSGVNDASLVAVAEITTPGGGVIQLVALGDLEHDGQARLLARLLAGSGSALTGVDVVKVAHHGSAKQDAELYRRLAPRIGLIGVGQDNDYGHPTPSALSMLSRLGIVVYRTDRDHTVLVGVGPPAAVGWAPPLTVTRRR